MSDSIKEIVGTIAPETLHPHLASVLLLSGIAIVAMIAYFVDRKSTRLNSSH